MSVTTRKYLRPQTWLLVITAQPKAKLSSILSKVGLDAYCDVWADSNDPKVVKRIRPVIYRTIPPHCGIPSSRTRKTLCKWLGYLV